MKFSIRFMTLTAVTAAIYVALTLIFAPISFGADGLLQFRISEITNLLAFLNPIFAPGVILGCFISNIMSPMGIWDMIFGTLGTVISVFMITRCKSLLTASICPAIGNIVVGIMIAVLYLPDGSHFIPYMFLAVGAVMLGEIVVVTIGGNLLFRPLMKNRSFMQFINNIAKRV